MISTFKVIKILIKIKIWSTRPSVLERSASWSPRHVRQGAEAWQVVVFIVVVFDFVVFVVVDLVVIVFLVIVFVVVWTWTSCTWAEVAQGGKQVHRGVAEVYLLFSECNFSAMLTRREASTSRRSRGVLASLRVNIAEESVVKAPSATSAQCWRGGREDESSLMRSQWLTWLEKMLNHIIQ